LAAIQDMETVVISVTIQKIAEKLVVRTRILIPATCETNNLVAVATSKQKKVPEIRFGNLFLFKL